MLVVLRDGRKLVGVMRSYDQYANLIFQDTVERILVGEKFVDIPKGLFLIRGENVVMLGEVDLDADPPPQLATVAPESIPELVKSHEEERALRRKREVRKAEVMKAQKGFCEEGAEGDNY
ncbi:hypothetical protein BCV69DRAFT_282890 [Microstroma glucosiphilum]|uniref:U6 snRNA-associated Sm-like protein LSm1 n=1 Tax=Pseudomicrostroma glucosiphilum TaxID=1684307 RepID=A0A316U876_9BASI|nr:hypothetical protein BCV69DRAFT_282890 [Pseudomicrostroma glucosiphilum]PWN20671.1 hypothetical protein BCV69DRAFT_282890 [Pseudomicrostroma glucosiphilum]